tara:strand:+ start:345 stop:587 length:243 start_codon:yes stop_codon:yes gene_type:complete
MEQKETKNIAVKKDTEIKEWLVEYVGNKECPEDENVTVDMIVNVLADEFPEFLLAVAEENFLRGYEQAMTDLYGTRDEIG